MEGGTKAMLTIKERGEKIEQEQAMTFKSIRYSVFFIAVSKG